MTNLTKLFVMLMLLSPFASSAQITYLDRGAWTWSVSSSSSVAGDNGGANALHDGDTSTYWHSDYSSDENHNCPHWILIDRNSDNSEIAGLAYNPRVGNYNNMITQFRVYVSDKSFGQITSVSREVLGEPTCEGSMSGESEYSEHTYAFNKPVTGRYLLFVIDNTNSGRSTAVAEFNLVSKFNNSMLAAYNSVQIITKTNDKHHISLDDGNLVITKNGTKLRMENTGIAVEYGMDEVEYFAFETYNFKENEFYVGDKKAGIENIENSKISIRRNGATIEICGIDAARQVRLISLDGSVAVSTKVSADGKASIQVAGLSSGVYLLNIDGDTFKIIL